jgi:hypothetical protein
MKEIDTKEYLKLILRNLLEEQKEADKGIYSTPFVNAPLGRFEDFSHFLRLEGEFEPRLSSKATLAILKTDIFFPESLPHLLPVVAGHNSSIVEIEGDEKALHCPFIAFCQEEFLLVGVVDSLDGKRDQYKNQLIRESLIMNILSHSGLTEHVIKIESEVVQVKEYRIVRMYLKNYPEKPETHIKTFFSKIRKIDEILSSPIFCAVEYDIRESLWQIGKSLASIKPEELVKILKAGKFFQIK